MTALPVVGHPFGSAPLPPPKPGLVVVPVDGETVVYDPEADLLHHLDQTASAVWSHLDGDVTLHVLAVRMASIFGASERAVRADIADLAVRFWDRGLLSGSEPSATTAPRQPARYPVRSGPLSTPHQQSMHEQPLPEGQHRTRSHRALQHVFEVATNNAAVRDDLEEILIDLASPGVIDAQRYELLDLGSQVGRQQYLIRFNGKPVIATELLDRALAVLLWHVNAEAVRCSIPRYPIVHAAAAVSRGVAVLLPARAESGKTTTVAGLVRAGFGYLTDEAVAIDPDTLFAQPYAKALSLSRGSWGVLADLRPPQHDQRAGQWHLPARRIRPGAVAGPAPVGFLVTPVYSAGSRTALEPVSPGAMLMHLADSTFEFQDDAQRNLSVLAQVVGSADCYRLCIGDLDHAVRLIDELVGSEQLDVAEGEPPFAQRRH
ncbi:MAG TPA: PqqD family protein [Jiangellaceae bacterium]